MVKDFLAGPKNSYIAKMRREWVNTVSSITHTNFKALREKNDKSDTVELSKRMLYGSELPSYKET